MLESNGRKPEPAHITRLDPSKLHRYWGFLSHALEDVIRANSRNIPNRKRVPFAEVLKRTKVRWRAEDIYSALQYKTATAYLLSRNRRLLGFVVVHPQPINFSHLTELFIWVGWTIPPAQRRPDDDVEGAIRDGMAFLERLRRQGNHTQITSMSSRARGLSRRYPFIHEEFVSYSLRLNENVNEEVVDVDGFSRRS